MQHLPLSLAEINELNLLVLHRAAHPNNKTIHSLIRNKTEQLLYELPSFLNLLEEEDCCEFFLYCYDSIDNFISRFSHGRLTFYAYIVELVRHRCRFFLLKKDKETFRERVILEHDYFLNEEADTHSEVAQTCTYTVLSATQQNVKESLQSLFSLLLKAKRVPQPNLPEYLKTLQTVLQKPINRKRFIILLTLSPNLFNEYLLEDMSCVLEVDPKLLNKYLNRAADALAKKQECKKRFETISNNHFRRLLEIEAKLAQESEPDEKLRLEHLRNWTSSVYKKKVEQIRKMEGHLSHQQIASLLDIPKGTIDSSVHYMKRLLQECMDEKLNKGYL